MTPLDLAQQPANAIEDWLELQGVEAEAAQMRSLKAAHG